VGPASYSFSGKQDNQQKSDEATPFTALVNKKQTYSLTCSTVTTTKTKRSTEKLPLIVTTIKSTQKFHTSPSSTIAHYSVMFWGISPHSPIIFKMQKIVININGTWL
jgi:hypothetical protein